MTATFFLLVFFFNAQLASKDQACAAILVNRRNVSSYNYSKPTFCVHGILNSFFIKVSTHCQELTQAFVGRPTQGALRLTRRGYGCKAYENLVCKQKTVTELYHKMYLSMITIIIDPAYLDDSLSLVIELIKMRLELASILTTLTLIRPRS